MGNHMIKLVMAAVFLAVFSAAEAQNAKLPIAPGIISVMQEDILTISREIEIAKQESEKYSGGTIKLNIESRIEILKLTKSLLEQRIVATKTGSKLKLEAPATNPQNDVADSLRKEIETIDKRIEEMQKKADQYKGGLIQVQILSTVATMEETRALLERRMLTAKYGLSILPTSYLNDSKNTETKKDIAAKNSIKPSPISEQLISVNVRSKEYVKEKYSYGIYFDMQFNAVGLPKPARAIKGSLIISDLFGELIASISWPIDDPLDINGVKIIKNEGFEFNQFKSEHIRIRDTSHENFRYSYRVKSIIFQDGTREDF
jgi:hypothetical protein